MQKQAAQIAGTERVTSRTRWDSTGVKVRRERVRESRER
jgi:hypothetical protein